MHDQAGTIGGRVRASGRRSRPSGQSGRTAVGDTIRLSLTIQVLVVHLMIVYAGTGWCAPPHDVKWYQQVVPGPTSR